MQASAPPTPMIEANSTVVLVSNVTQGDWVTILPDDLAHFLASGKPLRVIPIESSTLTHTVGLITEHQEPHTPVLQALMDEARALTK